MSAEKGRRILIIEDDLDISASLREFLTDEGFETFVARNGSEGLEQLEAEGLRPDVILLDLMMPVMDGFEFRRRQHANPELAAIPVVVMSADAHARQKQAEIGAAAFLKKPLDVEELLSIIERVV